MATKGIRSHNYSSPFASPVAVSAHTPSALRQPLSPVLRKVDSRKNSQSNSPVTTPKQSVVQAQLYHDVTRVKKKGSSITTTMSSTSWSVKISSNSSDKVTPKHRKSQDKQVPQDLKKKPQQHQKNKTPAKPSGSVSSTDDLIDGLIGLHISPSVVRRKSRSPSLSKSARKIISHGTPRTSMKEPLMYSPSTWNQKKRHHKFDRFIPNRDAMDMKSSQFIMSRDKTEDLTQELSRTDDDTTSTLTFTRSLSTMDSVSFAQQFEVAKACGIALDKRILAYQEKQISKERGTTKLTRPLKPAEKVAVKRKIATVPERILDAPGLSDDFYLHLLDWSPRNHLAVGLGNSVYIWNGDSGSVEELCTLDDEEGVSALSWSLDGSYLSVADYFGNNHLYDIDSYSKIRTIRGSNYKIGSLSWNAQLLSAGFSNGIIQHHDVRIAQSRVSVLHGHGAEVCGLKWNHQGSLLASGGNDNVMNIWDARTTHARYTKREHRGAVRALAWCPWQSALLASGGGSDDKKINFWNTSNGQLENTLETPSQVTGLLWSKNYKEFVASHGFTDNGMTVWKYPTLRKVVDLPVAHDDRVLHMAMSPDGQVVCSGSPDENLKFWRLFSCDPKTLKMKTGSSSSVDPKKPYKSPEFAEVR